MFYSLTDFLNKYSSIYWMFGFIIAFIVILIFFYFIDRIFNYQKKNKINMFKFLDKKNKVTKKENKVITDNSQHVDKVFKKIKRPRRSSD